jgi:hypothetical protein
MDIGDRIARRYRIERLVGRGGMARVYEVTDESTGARVALKRLAPSANEKHAALLFQREYNTLAELAHPLIVRAYDYGFDEDVPYYTMELIVGQNLRTLAPLPWREACSVIRDVASALAIVHSRRLVHRDVTARNVCRLEDQHAKLFDFGALTPMGPTRYIVGTPAYISPEALEFQSLDGRADLFALGALAYYVITGRHAFAAKDLSDLVEAWGKPVIPPSTLVKHVPHDLDELILSLLSLNRAARPTNAAAVFERLTAVANLEAAESPEVARAYLSTPTLVGRENLLARFRRQMTRVRRGRGASLFVEGPSGVGRSRLLGSFLIEAKLEGGLRVLRAEGAESQATPFGVARALARQLMESDAVLARDAAGSNADVLAPAVFAEDEPGGSSDTLGPEQWPTLISAFAEWFLAVAEKTPLVVAVDDIDRSDEPTLAILTELCRERERPVLLVVTAPDDSRQPGVTQLRAQSSTMRIEALRAEDTQELVSSLFGNVSHVEATAEWVHRLAQGNPRTTLDVAQHLVDRGVAAYTDGSWSLPETFESLGLPENLDQALDAKVAGLSEDARGLAQALALTTEHEPLLIGEYPKLWGERDIGKLFLALNELVAASVLIDAGAAYLFASKQLAESVRRNLRPERLAQLHRSIARALESEWTHDTILTAYHLFLAGDESLAFDRAVAAATTRTDTSARGAVLLRSWEGARLVEKLYLWGREHGARRPDIALLGRNVLQLASITDVALAKHADTIIEPLKREAGLIHWNEFADSTDPSERVQRCVGAAFMAHESTPEDQRGLHPIKAIEELAVSAGLLIGIYAREFQPQNARALLELMTPLRPLSPAVDIVTELVSYADGGLRGFYTREQRLRVLERVSEPVTGIDELTRVGIRLLTMYYLALEDAVQGYEGAAGLVAPLDEHAHTAPLAWQVRMISHLFKGEDRRAAEARRKRDAAALGRLDVDQHFDLSVLYEAAAFDHLGDLLGLKRAVSAIEERARRSPGWTPYALLYRGGYLALRGELAAAVDHYERGLALVDGPSAHSSWSHLVNHLTVALIDTGDTSRAHDLISKAVADSEDCPLLPLYHAQLQGSFALAEAAIGKGPEASARVRRAVEMSERLGCVGVTLVDQYAKEAKVALLVGDRPSFQAAAQRIEAICVKSESTSFAAKHAGLLRLAESPRGFAAVAAAPTALVLSGDGHTTMASGIRTELELCGGPDERARRALHVLTDWAAAGEAFLYLSRSDHLSFVASTSGKEPPPSLDATIANWLRTSSEEEETETQLLDEEPSTDLDTDFELVALVAQRGGESLLAGVGALKRGDSSLRRLPTSILNALGEGLLAAGDASGMRMDG